LQAKHGDAHTLTCRKKHQNDKKHYTTKITKTLKFNLM